MSADLPTDPLAPLEAELHSPDSYACPVCRRLVPLADTACDRCGADLTLLAGVLHDAQQRQTALYQALLAGDAPTAWAHLEALVWLTGPTTELAALRKLLRAGTVPAEVIGRPLWSTDAAALPLDPGGAGDDED